MKPLAARACARPLTAPSTMTLLEQPNRARCTINCRIHRSLMERARSRSSAGYRPATLSLDSLVGSLAARPIASLGPSEGISSSGPIFISSSQREAGQTSMSTEAFRVIAGDDQDRLESARDIRISACDPSIPDNPNPGP